MKKISIVAPIFQSRNRLGESVLALREIFKGRYDYQIICYYSGNIPTNVSADEHIKFVFVKDDYGFENCVRDGFEVADGDCVVVADLNSRNFKEYIVALVAKWESGSDVVLMQKDQNTQNFFEKCGNFFSKIFKKIGNWLLGLAGFNKDFDAMRTFQLFSDNVVEVIKAFPQKNYYLRNFDCWVDYKVSILYTKEVAKVTNTTKTLNTHFALGMASLALFVAMLFTVIFTANLVNANSRAIYVLIGSGLTIFFFIFAMYMLYKWFVFKKTKISQKDVQ